MGELDCKRFFARWNGPGQKFFLLLYLTGIITISWFYNAVAYSSRPSRDVAMFRGMLSANLIPDSR